MHHSRVGIGMSKRRVLGAVLVSVVGPRGVQLFEQVVHEHADDAAGERTRVARRHIQWSRRVSTRRSKPR